MLSPNCQSPSAMLQSLVLGSVPSVPARARRQPVATSSRERIVTLWHDAAQPNREEYFGAVDANRWTPADHVHDARTPFIGYLGRKFQAGRDPLLLAINPGGGGPLSNQSGRVARDRTVYPRLREFRNQVAGSAALLRAFDACCDVLEVTIPAWNLAANRDRAPQQRSHDGRHDLHEREDSCQGPPASGGSREAGRVT